MVRGVEVQQQVWSISDSDRGVNKCAQPTVTKCELTLQEM